MSPEQALSTFETYLSQRSLRRTTLAPDVGIEAMLAFYRTERADGCLLERDDDMLLYQWGAYDWGKGESFELDVTRQLIVGSGEDNDIWQLSLTFKFPVTAKLRAIRAGNKGCANLEELAAFEKFIYSSESYQAVSAIAPQIVELDYGCAG